MGFIVAYSFIFWSRILTHLTLGKMVHCLAELERALFVKIVSGKDAADPRFIQDELAKSSEWLDLTFLPASDIGPLWKMFSNQTFNTAFFASQLVMRQSNKR